jgi:hypothetical protein
VRFQVLTAEILKMAALCDAAPCCLVEDVSEVRTASIIRAMMKAVNTPETSVYFNETT